MVWQPVRAGRDHLGQFSNRSAVDAIAEPVWNGLDAEAGAGQWLAAGSAFRIADDAPNICQTVGRKSTCGPTPCSTAAALIRAPAEAVCGEYHLSRR
ncbi:hypothetical protein [Amycolatopsis sp. NBC_00438]|uniref:hypothetical protein n=1 Tax=Amycolatopsis sp. NBC_00438 TaxID=2903558 RepID=UPI002E1D7142